MMRSWFRLLLLLLCVMMQGGICSAYAEGLCADGKRVSVPLCSADPSHLEDIVDDEEASREEHDWSDWYDVDRDVKKRICYRCGRIQTHNHIWDDGVIIHEATESERGEMEFYCKFCDGNKTVYYIIRDGEVFRYHYIGIVSGPILSDTFDYLALKTRIEMFAGSFSLDKETLGASDIIIKNGAKVILDLNGYKLNSGDIVIENGASLTITDSSDENQGVILCGITNQGGDVILDSGKFYISFAASRHWVPRRALIHNNCGALYINDGVIIENDISNGEGARIFMYGGSINASKTCGISNHGGEVVINGGTVKAPENAIYNDEGSLSIYGGEFICEGKPVSPGAPYPSDYKFRTEVVYSYDGITNIAGGTYDGGIYGIPLKFHGGTANISGGIFKGIDENGTYIETKLDSSLSITGGVFETTHTKAGEELSDFIDNSAYQIVQRKDGRYQVVPIEAGITLTGRAGQFLASIPPDAFNVTVTVTDIPQNAETVCIATYTSTGQFRGSVIIPVDDALAGTTFSRAVYIENPDKDIAQLKVFMLSPGAGPISAVLSTPSD